MTWLLSKIVGNPVVLIVLLVAAAACGGSVAWRVQGLRLESAKQKTVKVQQAFAEFQQATTTAGQKSKAEQLAKEEAHERNLSKVRSDHEQEIKSVRSDAVAKYIANRVRVAASSGGGGVRQNSLSLRVDDGAQQKCIPDDEFIRDAAEDAEKLSAWQDWCRLNECPVE